MAVDELYLRDLAASLGPEWESLSTHLGFARSDIYQFKVDNDGLANQIFEMLASWLQRQGTPTPATADTLLSALRTVKRGDLADKLQVRVTAMSQGAAVDMADADRGSIPFKASNPPQPSTQPQSQPSGQTDNATTYQLPAGTAPYVGKLTITGRNSPVIIGPVSNSTFNFGGGGGD